jgi:hypothetical protein
VLVAAYQYISGFLVSYPEYPCQEWKTHLLLASKLPPILGISDKNKKKEHLQARSPKNVLIADSRQPGSLSHIGFRPMALRRHLSVTLPVQFRKLS